VEVLGNDPRHVLADPAQAGNLLAQAAPDVVAEKDGDEGSDRLYRCV
jgi:hypothetical protein